MGSLDGGKRLEYAVAVMRAAWHDPRISRFEHEGLISQMQFGASVDDITGGFIVAHAFRVIVSDLDIFPKSHPEAYTACQIFLPHPAFR